MANPRAEAHQNRKASHTPSTDRGYAWLVLLGCFMIDLINSSSFMVGLFLVEFQHHFGVSATRVSWIGALQHSVGTIAGFAIGPLIKYTSPRFVTVTGGLIGAFACLLCWLIPNMTVLFIFYGAVAGTSYSSIYMSANIIIQHHFDKRRSFANSVFNCGGSIAYFCLPPFFRVYMDKFGWQGALLMVGGLFLQTTVCGAIMRPMRRSEACIASQKGIGISPEVNKQRFGCSTHKLTVIVMYTLGDLCAEMGYRVYLIYTAMRCDMLGLTKAETAWLYTIFGIVGIPTRPLAGLMADRPSINRTFMLGISAALGGGMILVTTAMKTFQLLVASSALFCFLSAGHSVLRTPVMRDIVGLEGLDIFLGIRTTLMGICCIALTLGSGYLFDTANLNMPFLVFGGIYTFGGLLIASIPIMMRLTAHTSIPVPQMDEGDGKLEVLG